jgi:hypothetical protein
VPVPVTEVPWGVNWCWCLQPELGKSAEQNSREERACARMHGRDEPAWNQLMTARRAEPRSRGEQTLAPVQGIAISSLRDTARKRRGNMTEVPRRASWCWCLQPEFGKSAERNSREERACARMHGRDGRASAKTQLVLVMRTESSTCGE